MVRRAPKRWMTSPRSRYSKPQRLHGALLYNIRTEARRTSAMAAPA
ncbi:hypothetical protein ACFY2H_37700 [Streptomyces griseofuscus]